MLGRARVLLALRSRSNYTRFIFDEFHRRYYWSAVWSTQTHWLGVPLHKCPLDLWLYQEILHRIKPELVIETGTAHGGSALYLAQICDLLGVGQIVSIDTAPRLPLPEHPRIEFILGSSTDPEIAGPLLRRARDARGVLVILDSDHSHDHVLQEMQIYGDAVTPGSYLIVEDTNINGHPALDGFGPGPMEAVDDFLMGSSDFSVDLQCEKFLLTMNPRGYLLRK